MSIQEDSLHHLCPVKRLPLMVAQFIVGIAFLSVFGWAVKHRTKGDLDLGWANVIVDQLAGFPDSSRRQSNKALPGTFVPTPNGLNPSIIWKTMLTLTAYSNEDDGRTIAIRNLRSGEILHEWNVLRTPFQ